MLVAPQQETVGIIDRRVLIFFVNFVREMVLNLFFIFLVLVGVGIWMQIGNGNNSEQTARGALLL
ncbi:hypothetical protein MJM99_32310, partial [Salmonella enterica subsp. enterica serovar Kentucky]|nr:hypothetical protein [Salmonella enterica subsp. enterica serovar Kentucky]